MHIKDVRIYTNFDGYMAINHDVALGIATYRNVRFNLDDKENRNVLIETLINDNIIEMIDEPGRDVKRTGHAYRIVHRDYRFLNRKHDDRENRMQETALLMNLMHNTHLFITN